MSSSHRYNLSRSRRRRGFTFTEVMFAVILLGIGFIMLAGMFPVAIRQTQSTQEESFGANIAQGGARYLEQVALAAEYPETNGQIWGLTKDAWLRLEGNLVSSQDPRYGWTVLYKRNAGENYAQVVIIAARCNIKPAFDASDTAPAGLLPDNGTVQQNNGYKVPNLYPRRLSDVTLKRGEPVDTGVPDTIEFSKDEPALAPGAFVVVGTNADRPVRVFRLGNEITARKKYELDPGYAIDRGELINPPKETAAWALGMGESRPGSGSYEGLPMDVAVYVTFVMLK